MRSKNALLNICTNFVLQIIIIIYGLIVPRIIIGFYGSNVNGLVTSITQFLGYIVLLESGFGPLVKSLLYRPIANKNKAEISQILKSSENFFRKISFVFVIYIICLSFFYPIIINKEFSFVFTFSLIIIISISTFFEYYFGMTYRLFLQASQKTYIISLVQIITYIINIILVLVLIKFGIGIHLLKIITCLIFMSRPIIQNVYVKKKYHINLKSVDKINEIKNKWDGLAQHIAYVIHTNTDVVILTIFTNLYEVSVYSVYYLVVSGIKSLIQSFSVGIDASFGDMIAKNEIVNLNKRFKMYEVLYNSIITIVFSCTLVLIVPFVSIYTKGITDVNYVRYLFGTLIVLSEYIWAIRLPYSSMTLTAGHFKETRKGAWIECLTNIILSIILVWKYGIIGVTIGTIVAMSIRTCEFIYHTNKYILIRPIWISIKKVLLLILETIIIFIISKFLPFVEYTSYIQWIINAILVFSVALLVTLSINYIIYKQEFKESLDIILNIIKKKDNR